MLRRISLLVATCAFVLAACGRQVTQEPAGTGTSIAPGNMLIRYRTAGPLDFANYKYVIVFNTTGNGQEPYANGFQTGFSNYSFAWVISGSGGVLDQPRLFQYYLLPGSSSGLQTRAIVVPPNAVQLIGPPNSNGQANEFTLIFDRRLFNVPNPTSTTGPTPGPTATPLLSPLWNINFFVVDQNNVPLDALGTSGVRDVSYNLQVNVGTFFDIVDRLSKPAGAIGGPTQSATLSGGEILNNP